MKRNDVLLFWAICALAGGCAAAGLSIGWGHMWPALMATLLLVVALGLTVFGLGMAGVPIDRWIGEGK